MTIVPYHADYQYIITEIIIYFLLAATTMIKLRRLSIANIDEIVRLSQHKYTAHKRMN